LDELKQKFSNEKALQEFKFDENSEETKTLIEALKEASVQKKKLKITLK
jgi:hypothetical protein